MEGPIINQEAVGFVERHRDFFELYAKGRIKIEPAPEGLDTFAFDLNTNTIYVNSKFYRDLGLSEEKTTFATLHGIEHFLEKAALLSEEGGQEVFDNYLKRIKEDRAFALLDNCVADIRENRSVVARKSQAFADLESDLYRKELFPSADLTQYEDKEGNLKPAPKHIQFAQAILREHRLPGEVCSVSPEVREKLDELYSLVSKKGKRYLDIMTDPKVPMSTRLALQEEFIEPLMKELLEKDKIKEKERRKDGKMEKEESELGKENKGETGEIDPNEAFEGAYERAEKKVMNAVPIDEMEKALDEWKEANKESAGDKADKEYAQNIGVRPEDLKHYRDIVSGFEKIVNPETGESVIEELRRIIERIIASRLKPALSPRYPTEEGEELVDPAMALAEVKRGNLEPKVWESIEIKEKKGQKFGEIEITLVCDKSSSMNDPSAKLIEQRKAAILMMEVLKEFADIADEERINMDKPLEIRSEVYAFQRDLAKDSIPLKKMSKELGEKERIDVSVEISSAPGGTTDFVPLETIDANLKEEDLRKIKEGELKKIVIVFTDGESDDKSRVKTILNTLRNKGVIAIGIGITESGTAALETYAPNSRLAEKAENLVIILADLLKEHLVHI